MLSPQQSVEAPKLSTHSLHKSVSKGTRSQNRARDKVKISLFSCKSQFSPIKFNQSRTNILTSTHNAGRNTINAHFKSQRSAGHSASASTGHQLRKTINLNLVQQSRNHFQQDQRRYQTNRTQ